MSLKHSDLWAEKCTEFRKYIAYPGVKETLRKKLAWNDDFESDPEVLRVLTLLLLVSEANVNDRPEGLKFINHLGTILVEQGLIGPVLPEVTKRPLYFDLTKDNANNKVSNLDSPWNVAAHQLFGDMPSEMAATAIYANSVRNALLDVKNEDTIHARLKRWKNEIEKAIDGEIRENKLPIDRDDLMQSFKSNLDKYCDELLEPFAGVWEYAENSYGWIQRELINRIQAGDKQIILTGAPGTGKTRMAKNIAERLGAALEDEKKYKLVQFHPSYDYTDFVEGLRPYEPGGDGDKPIAFRRMDGVFKDFCRKVAKKNHEVAKKNGKKITAENAGKVVDGKLYFFLIDEINRADLSKVFGELMYCLEADKRGEAIDTQYQNLRTYDKNGEKMEEDVFEAGFYIPPNVVVIGTMNDIDRSVESMDFALRRRFTWREVEVNEKFLKSVFAAMMVENDIICDGLADKLTERVMALNKDVLLKEGKEYRLNQHFFISQGQFSGKAAEWRKLGEACKDKLNEDGLNIFLENIWNSRIRLLIAEYVRGENDAIEFVRKCETKLLDKA